MFTGIIQTTGHIQAADPLADEGGGLCLHITADAGLVAQLKLGDSVAVQGVCLTVTELTHLGFKVEVSRATLECTTGFAQGNEVNLERALRLGDGLDGHWVSGHVDGVGFVVQCATVGESVRLTLAIPDSLALYCAAKGSLTVDGVSLTLNRVTPPGAARPEVEINLVPYTLAHTTLQHLAPGKGVNLEVDLLARYVVRATQRHTRTDLKR